MTTVIIPIVILLTLCWVFNPYMAHRERTVCERWQTRERSYGHPLYWKIRYLPGGWGEAHRLNLFNRPCKKRCYIKNVMYIE